MTMLKHALRVLSVLMLGVVSGCGWQLQGVHRIPETVSPLYLDLVDEHSAFAIALGQRLHSAGVNLTTDRNQAQAVLRVNKDASGHHVSSVSALNEPQQYEVYYNVEYRLDRLPESGNLLTPQPLSASRTMSYDKTLALAKQREELSLRDTLAEELVDQVLRRLSMLPHNTDAPGNNSDIQPASDTAI